MENPSCLLAQQALAWRRHEVRRCRSPIRPQARLGGREGPCQEARPQAPQRDREQGRADAMGEGEEEAMKAKEKLPRGVQRRGSSLMVSFALPDGRIERRSVGPVSVKCAAARRAIWRQEVAEGRYLGWQPRVKEHVHKVADLWDVYLTDYRNRGGKHERRWALAWRHLEPMFGSVPVTELSTNQINDYVASRRAEGADNATVNRETTLLKAMFNCGRRTTAEGAKPMVGHMPAFPKRLKESEPRTGFVTDEQYERLRANANQLWLRALIAAAYSFGFRKGELLNLRVRQVDLLDRWIELETGTTKNGEARKVRMTSEVFELMRACLRNKVAEDYVFTREDGSRVVDPRDAWYELCVKSGLGQYITAEGKTGEYRRYLGLNLHDFRRSAIRNMTRRGISDKTAMRISGHKTFSVFQRYNIVDEADLVRASQLIERGRQDRANADVKTDTKTDTHTYAVS